MNLSSDSVVTQIIETDKSILIIYKYILIKANCIHSLTDSHRHCFVCFSLLVSPRALEMWCVGSFYGVSVYVGTSRKDFSTTEKPSHDPKTIHAYEMTALI